MSMTKDEVKLITFVLVALLAGAATKYYRGKHPRSLMITPPPKQTGPSSRRW